jgi:hypothetical protein
MTNENKPITKTDFIALTMTKNSWTGLEIRQIIARLELKSVINGNKPIDNSIKVGDVIGTALNHPALVIKVKSGIAICVIMTTEVTCTSIICEQKSRFTQGYITASITTYTIEEAFKRYQFSYDNYSHIREILKLIKVKYKSILGM